MVKNPGKVTVAYAATSAEGLLHLQQVRDNPVLLMDLLIVTTEQSNCEDDNE